MKRESVETQRGFTLIEMMIVIAIIAVLSAIALPAYQDYVIRSKMAEPLDALAEAKSAVSSYVAATRSYPGDPALFGLKLGTRYSDILHSLTLTPNPLVPGGTVYLTANVYTSVIEGGAKDDLNVLSFQLSGSTNADGSMRWECLPGSGPNGVNPVPIRYLPSTCSG